MPTDFEQIKPCLFDFIYGERAFLDKKSSKPLAQEVIAYLFQHGIVEKVDTVEMNHHRKYWWKKMVVPVWMNETPELHSSLLARPSNPERLGEVVRPLYVQRPGEATVKWGAWGHS